VRRLLAADRVRFGGRRDLWALVFLVPIAMALMFVNDFNGVVERFQMDMFFDPEFPPDPEMEEQFRQQVEQMRQSELPPFAFPASLLKMAGSSGAAILFGVYAAIALVAGEFEWGTMRTVHLTSSRAQVLAVRIGVILGLVGVALALAIALAAFLPFLLSVEGRPLQDFSAPVDDLWTSIGLRILIVLPFVSIPVLVSVVTRSTSLGFLITILVLVVDLAITGVPFWRDSAMEWVPAVTITGSIARLLGGEATPLASVPGVVSLAALIWWSLAPALAAIGLIRRLDLE
jgi:hypothetical protein